MNEQIIEAMARADGYEYSRGTWHHVDRGALSQILPDYLTDANQIDRMVRGLDKVQLIIYSVQLAKIVRRDSGCTLKESEFTMLQATIAQEVEAYLKAKGLWTKEME